MQEIGSRAERIAHLRKDEINNDSYEPILIASQMGCIGNEFLHLQKFSCLSSQYTVCVLHTCFFALFVCKYFQIRIFFYHFTILSSKFATLIPWLKTALPFSKYIVNEAIQENKEKFTHFFYTNVLLFTFLLVLRIHLCYKYHNVSLSILSLFFATFECILKCCTCESWKTHMRNDQKFKNALHVSYKI